MKEALKRHDDEAAACCIEAKVELGARFAIACRIKELSPSAFEMQISDVLELPDVFDLLIPVVKGVDQRRRARMVWRKDDRVGGVFLRPHSR